MLYLKFSIFKIEQTWVKKQQLLNLNSVVVNFYSIYIYVYKCIYVYIYIYIYREREREREGRERVRELK